MDAEEVVGSIYPAALIGKAPLFGSVYMPYRLIFTDRRVIAFYPDPQKAFRSGFKLLKLREYSRGRWDSLLNGTEADKVVTYGKNGVNEDMLKAGKDAEYGSLTYDKIGGVLLRPGEEDNEFNMLFRPSDTKVLIRGLEFSIAKAALKDVRRLLGKTLLSGLIESGL